MTFKNKIFDEQNVKFRLKTAKCQIKRSSYILKLKLDEKIYKYKNTENLIELNISRIFINM